MCNSRVAHIGATAAAMPSADRARVVFQAVGFNAGAYANANFCSSGAGEVAVAADTAGDPLWAAWSAAQRDVFFFVRGASGRWNSADCNLYWFKV